MGQRPDGRENPRDDDRELSPGDDNSRHAGDDGLHGDGIGFERVTRAAGEDGRLTRFASGDGPGSIMAVRPEDCTPFNISARVTTASNDERRD